MSESPVATRRQSTRFLWLYALAASGGAVAYVPFLTVLLQLRVGAMAPERTVDILAYIAFAGAIAASLGNIAFGWLSDRTGARRPWILCGLFLSGALLLCVPLATTPETLLALIVVWQVALNMMLAPLAAWAGDCVPDEQKGTLGGLLSFAPAFGAASGALVTLPGLASADQRLMLVVAMVAVLVLPVLLFGRPRPMPELLVSAGIGDGLAPPTTGKKQATVRMWLARLLVQIAEASLFAYLLIWFGRIEDGFGDHDTAILFTSVLALSIPLALIAGRWSDRSNRPIRPLAIGAGIGVIGLVGMALSSTLTAAIGAYVVFGLATSVFLALHSSQTLRVLPRPQTRGRDLGIFNLTNTVPSLIMPWLTIALVPLFGFQGLFLVLAALTALATVLLLTVPRAI
ncbi:MAG: MFS transporter [Citromicrobium sp.]|nr:MAG: MFS transporter [Citromicrobium sp.]